MFFSDNSFLDYKNCGDISQNFKLSLDKNDNYNYPESFNKKIDCVLPEDIQEMFYTEKLIIDCQKASVSSYEKVIKRNNFSKIFNFFSVFLSF